MRALTCGAHHCVVTAVILETCSLPTPPHSRDKDGTSEGGREGHSPGRGAVQYRRELETTGGAGERKTHSLRFDSSFNPVTSEKSADPLKS